MEPSTKVDPERALERTGDELEERLGRLDEHIGEARQAAHARRQEADPAAAAGDWEDTGDDSGGDDPATFDDPDQLEDADDLEDADEDQDEDET